MTEENYILALDHGTSGMKTAIVSTKGRLIGFEVEEYPMYHFEAGCAEQDPQEWWAALVNTAKKLISKNLVPADRILAVVSSNQMDGTIPIDKKGKSLSNCITWMDTRGATPIQKHFGGPISGYTVKTLVNWLKKTGGAPGLSGKDILAHILWIKDDHPDIYAQTWKFLDCKDYLNYRLTGQVATSYDCGILTWVVNDEDPNNIHYDEKLIELSGVDPDKLPPLYPATHIIGPLLPEIAQTLGLSPATRVVLGAGDMSTAAVGSGAVLPGQCHICVGSSSWVISHTPIRKMDVVHSVVSLPSAIPGQYILMGEQESAGINLSWIRDNFLYHKDKLLQDECQPDVYKIFDSLVKEVEPGSKNVIFTPWLFGERAPVEDHTIRGGLHNLSLDIDRRHMIRAIFEGVAYNSRWLHGYQEKLLHTRLDPIHFIGGGAASDVWCQIYADVLGRTIRQVKMGKEANSVGASLIASVALGEIDWGDIPNIVEFKADYAPNPANQAKYDQLFAEFVGLYNRNKKMYRRLNKFA